MSFTPCDSSGTVSRSGVTPDEVEDLSTFQDPHHDSRGFDLVLVNGVIVRDGGRPTCARPGMPLYGPVFDGILSSDGAGGNCGCTRTFARRLELLVVWNR